MESERKQVLPFMNLDTVEFDTDSADGKILVWSISSMELCVSSSKNFMFSISSPKNSTLTGR